MRSVATWSLNLNVTFDVHDATLKTARFGSTVASFVERSALDETSK